MEEFLNPALPFMDIVWYYIAFIPYYALLSPSLSLSVVFFTSKLAARSEIIAMQGGGDGLQPYPPALSLFVAIIALVSFVFSGWIIPKLNVIRIDFTNTGLLRQKVEVDQNIQSPCGARRGGLLLLMREKIWATTFPYRSLRRIRSQVS